MKKISTKISQQVIFPVDANYFIYNTQNHTYGECLNLRDAVRVLAFYRLTKPNTYVIHDDFGYIVPLSGWMHIAEELLQVEA